MLKSKDYKPGYPGKDDIRNHPDYIPDPGLITQIFCFIGFVISLLLLAFLIYWSPYRYNQKHLYGFGKVAQSECFINEKDYTCNFVEAPEGYTVRKVLPYFVINEIKLMRAKTGIAEKSTGNCLLIKDRLIAVCVDPGFDFWGNTLRAVE